MQAAEHQYGRVKPVTTELAAIAGRLGTWVAGRYRLVGVLGSGGTGAVYEAEQTSLGKRVAVKMLHPESARSRELVLRFQREARAATAIGHEHIVDVSELGVDESGAPFMVMELLRGRTLADVLAAEGALSVARALKIAIAICDALAAAHAKNVVHRDLKPENVFLARRSRDPEFVKVLDFGISKMLARDVAPLDLTRVGFALGTPAYMSPEQARGSREVDARSDVWALGVMLYEMLAGQRPFVGDSSATELVAVVSAHPTALRSLRQDVPPALERIIEHCLEKEYDARMPSMDALGAALATIAEQGEEERRAEIERPAVVASPAAPDDDTRRDPLAQTAARRAVDADATVRVTPPRVTRRSQSTTSAWSLLALGVAVAALVSITIIAIGRSGARANGMAPRAESPAAPAIAPTIPTAPVAAPTPRPPSTVTTALVTTGPAATAVTTAPLTTAPAIETAPAATSAIETTRPARSSAASSRAASSRAASSRAASSRAARVATTRDTSASAATPRVEPRADRPTRADAPAADGSGFLTLATTPPATVTLAGRRLGETPLIRHPLPAGRHLVHLSRPGASSESYEIEIRPGRRTTRRIELGAQRARR
jgi:tRNA A-37 threonylcarbamoyl transferase component Bud32